MIIANIIVNIVVIIFTLFFLVVLYAIKKTAKQGRDMDKLFADINDRGKGIRDIGEIEPAEASHLILILTSEFIILNRLSRLYKYEGSDDYWIEFFIENSTSEAVNFVLKKVNVCINNFKITCDKTLLFEKVPDHLSPPYGNRYFDTDSYNNYFLGAKAQKYFIFQSRFKIDPDHNASFKETDSIKIEIEFNRLNIEQKKYTAFDKVVFLESFKNMEFKKIQSLDEEIKWIG